MGPLGNRYSTVYVQVLLRHPNDIRFRLLVAINSLKIYILLEATTSFYINNIQIMWAIIYAQVILLQS